MTGMYNALLYPVCHPDDTGLFLTVPNSGDLFI